MLVDAINKLLTKYIHGAETLLRG